MNDITTSEFEEKRDYVDRRGGPWDRRSPTLAERIIVRVIAAFLVVGLSCAAGLLGFGFVIDEVQDQRYNALVMNCSETNDRHRKVNLKIDEAIAKIPSGPEKDEAEKGAVSFRIIINAAVPYTANCSDYANQRVKGVIP